MYVVIKDSFYSFCYIQIYAILIVSTYTKYAGPRLNIIYFRAASSIFPPPPVPKEPAPDDRQMDAAAARSVVCLRDRTGPGGALFGRNDVLTAERFWRDYIDRGKTWEFARSVIGTQTGGGGPSPNRGDGAPLVPGTTRRRALAMAVALRVSR